MTVSISALRFNEALFGEMQCREDLGGFLRQARREPPRTGFQFFGPAPDGN
ncbi:MAG: hypothetical protein LBK55_11970 [Azoarcus sp.]|jgi:hypothetical protein|nr:hypothetical protein [Azoarcus sp.]